MDKIERKTIQKELCQADAVLIGAGAGMSAAAGLRYSGERFERNFKDFIDRYGLKDMYSSGFFPFPSIEEKWAYWSRHICLNRYDMPAGKAYKDLYDLVKDKNYFVLTTNVDHQFWLAGFEDRRIFAVQGDYGLFQCRAACHKKLYDNEKQVKAMTEEQRDCRIPKALIPRCPVCGKEMEVNLRKDGFFVEDEKWHQAAGRYERFLRENRNKHILFLELGVGMNTPGIIKFPFWKLCAQLVQTSYVCINQGEAWAPEEIRNRSLCINGDIAEVLRDLEDEKNGSAAEA